MVSPSFLCSVVFSGLRTYLSFSFLSVLLCDQPEWQSPQFVRFFFFLLTITCRSGRQAEVKWSVCISKSQRILIISFSNADSELCLYHLFIWSNSNCLHNSQWITLPTLSCLDLYSFGANLLLSLVKWLIVSFLSPHNIYFVASCLLLLWHSPYGVVLRFYLKKFSFSLKVFLS